MTATGEKDPGEPVQVWVAPNELEAQVIKSYLASNDIPAVLQGGAASKVFGFVVGMMAEVRIYVPESFAEKAIELLEAASDEPPAGGDQAGAAIDPVVEDPADPGGVVAT